MAIRRAGNSRRAAWAGLAGFCVVAAYAQVGVLQLLVWEPLAAAPGASLDEIRAAVEQAGESLYEPVVVGWAVIGTVLAAAVLAGALARRLSVYQTLVLHLALLVLAAPSYFFASFGPGMALGDTFVTSGSYPPWGTLLYFVSLVAFAALVPASMLAARRPRA
ncbi:hypothetical protein [Zhihengliuella halotolerans]|uniref:hypothetical protein n=1 Tax=Zhihengliuella halotolerans TaxID=370736 RepID=UPI0011AECB7E|nr:hypothetical protein [Zhihengliuella halotolerans]